MGRAAGNCLLMFINMEWRSDTAAGTPGVPEVSGPAALLFRVLSYRHIFLRSLTAVI